MPSLPTSKKKIADAHDLGTRVLNTDFLLAQAHLVNQPIGQLTSCRYRSDSH